MGEFARALSALRDAAEGLLEEGLRAVWWAGHWKRTARKYRKNAKAVRRWLMQAIAERDDARRAATSLKNGARHALCLLATRPEEAAAVLRAHLPPAKSEES